MGGVGVGGRVFMSCILSQRRVCDMRFRFWNSFVGMERLLGTVVEHWT